MYLISHENDGEGNPLALSVDSSPMYEGYDVFNVDVTKYKGLPDANRNQQWRYNSLTNKLESVLIEGGILKEGGARNICVFGESLADGPSFQRDMKFRYEEQSKSWISMTSHWALEVKLNKVTTLNVGTDVQEDTET